MPRSLIVYSATPRGDATLREAVRAGGPLTVVALARVERLSPRCCDIRSTYWNGVQRELAESELASARLVVEDADDVTLEVLEVDVRRPAEAVLRRAGSDRIVVGDPGALGRRAMRQLRSAYRAGRRDGAGAPGEPTEQSRRFAAWRG